eukprot:TRINITY_DN7297_c0_g1_i2.p1 TRINITY_DN7297_c0_g1~~TRINITY_DN7297_c0_g1_i2.p1  ORF type:complete len:282 (-),score=18.57 TRINITY_DN7297_c0_g1_i2:575-1420(-)
MGPHFVLCVLLFGLEVQCKTEESYILIEFFNAMNGNQWNNGFMWMNETNPCSGWHGIYCSQDQVTQIQLISNNLTGRMSSKLSELTSLQLLDLSYNHIFGNFSDVGLSTLVNLTELNLANNEFIDSGLDEIYSLSKLQTIKLYSNRINGPILSNISQLVNLKTLDLAFTGMTGELPPELFNMSYLEALTLKGNSFSGTLPTIYSPLKFLDLSSNYLLSGTFPESIISSNTLLWLSLEYNNFSGTIPQLNNPNMDYLSLRSNQWNGSLPDFFATMTKLKYMY